MDFIPFSFIDLIDILLVALFMFGIYRMSRGTNAPYIFTGIIVIYFVWVVVRALNMELLQAILGQIVSVGVIALIILFQPEIRNFLQAIGRRQGPFRFINNFFNNRGGAESSLQPIITACSEMSITKTGALIVIAQRSDLADIVDSGITLDAKMTVPLLENIFFKNAPLHDGAVVIMANKVVCAGCYLPMTQDANLPREFGSRHRAAIALSESNSDLTVVVVSEETGIISAMHNGKVKRYLDAVQLKLILDSAMGLLDAGAEETIWGLK